MKVSRTLPIIIIAIFTVFATPRLEAQDSGSGLGIIIGNPTGVSFKSWLSGNSALDLAAAWSLNDERLLIQGSYILHDVSIFKVSKGKLALYYGIGGAIVLTDDVGVAARVPVGLDYMFATAPFDIFVELAPSLLLVPKTDFRIGAAVGVRFWFD